MVLEIQSQEMMTMKAMKRDVPKRQIIINGISPSNAQSRVSQSP